MKGPRVIHPFLFAVFPVLFLYAQNLDEAQPRVIVIPLAAVLAFALIVYSLLSTRALPKSKAGIVVSMFIVFWFSFGRIATALNSLLVPYGFFGWEEVQVPLFLLLVWGVFSLKIAYWLKGPQENFFSLTRFLNALAFLLLSIPLFQMAFFSLQSLSGARKNDLRQVGTSLPPREMNVPPPDIYYFILDGYARADVLKQLFNFNNRSFLDSLTTRGFFVAEESRSNYAQTGLSLASSLNMDYLQTTGSIRPETGSRRAVAQLIHSNYVAAFLKERGYRIISFRSGYPLVDLAPADTFLAVGGGMNEFQSVLIDTTPLPLLLPELDLFSQAPGLGTHLQGLRHFDFYESKRRDILYAVGKIPEIAKAPGPKFVFVHMLVPHPPFVFGSNGEPKRPRHRSYMGDGNHFMKAASQREYAEGYIAQLGFTNEIVIRSLDALLAASPRPPVIILQGDHGSGLELKWEDPEGTNLQERLSILNAYYFPGGEGQLYKGITPVNTFRVVFNRHFGTKFDLLPDRCYFSTWSQPYKFIDVTLKTSPPAADSPSARSLK